MQIGLAFCVDRPPASALSANSAPINSRWLFNSHSTPLPSPPSGGQGEDDIAIRHIAFTLEADEVDDGGGVRLLDVLRATSVKIAVFLYKLKGIGGPIFTIGLYHIQMADDQHRFLLRTARSSSIARNQVAMASIGAHSTTTSFASKPASSRRLRIASAATVLYCPRSGRCLVSINCWKYLSGERAVGSVQRDLLRRGGQVLRCRCRTSRISMARNASSRTRRSSSSSKAKTRAVGHPSGRPDSATATTRPTRRSARPATFREGRAPMCRQRLRKRELRRRTS